MLWFYAESLTQKSIQITAEDIKEIHQTFKDADVISWGEESLFVTDGN